MLGKRISEVAALIRQGKYSATELSEECLTRMEKLRFLNMFITEVPEQARNQAMQIEKSNGKDSGKPLQGIPISVKDNFSTKDIRTTCASLMLKDYVPPYNATVVEKLLNNGSVIVGKTNMDEFAMGCGSVDGAFGPVKNPWSFVMNGKNSEGMKKGDDNDDGWFISGGSSGGSAVSVAVGAAFASLGSDTGGSTRNPASYCGVVGLKSTYGLLSRHGLIPLVNSMDVPGIVARSVDDAALVLNALAGHDPLDSTTASEEFEQISLPERPNVEGLVVGIPKEYHCAGLSQDVIDLWRSSADKLERGGAIIKEVSLPHTDLSIACYHVLCACEVASNMARYDGLRYGHRSDNDSSTEAMYAISRYEAFNDVVKSRILAGNYFLLKNNYDDYYVRAQKIRRLIHDDFVKVYNSGVDVLLTPTVLSDAPEYDSFSKADNRTRTAEQDVCTEPANMAGVPAISVPVGFSSRSLPIGMQLIGQHFKEKMLLNAAKFLEQESRFPQLIENDRFKKLLQ